MAQCSRKPARLNIVALNISCLFPAAALQYFQGVCIVPPSESRLIIVGMEIDIDAFFSRSNSTSRVSPITAALFNRVL